MAKTLKTTIYLLLLAITLGCAKSARILDEVDPQPPVIADDSPEASNAPATTVPAVAPVVGPTTALPSGQVPAAATGGTTVAHADPPHLQVTEEPDIETAPVADVAPVAVPAATSPSGPASVAATSATVAHADPHHPTLSFFMHDILGGSHPSGRVVTGIVANSQINGLPFSKPNGGVFPINGGVPLINGNNGIINNNNLPFLTGLNGGASTTSTVIQNTGNNNVANGGNTLPFVTAGQLPAGATLQKLMFGSITVIDDELTEGHELGSAVVGAAQGFYLASSLDGSSQTMALTALFHGGDHDHHDEEGSLSFFGVHRTASPESQVAIIGGTGKYENAKGYATVETLHQEDQHTTDGVDTILQFNVYLSL